MINYETYCQIRLFHQQRGLSFNQIPSDLGIRPQTVAKYANLTTFTRRLGTKRGNGVSVQKLTKSSPLSGGRSGWEELGMSGGGA